MRNPNATNRYGNAAVPVSRYAFDMSKFSRARDVAYGIRERYLWELMWPDPNDPFYKNFPKQFSSEMHERLLAPIYPFFFAAVAFAFLGLARTTRQSRNFSMVGAVLSAFCVRLAGFDVVHSAHLSGYAALAATLLLLAGVPAPAPEAARHS